MIAVTGGAGFIGSVLLWKLNALGRNDLLVVDQRAKGSPKWRNVEKRTFDAYYESDEFLGRLEKGEFDGRLEAIFHMGACSDTTEMDRAYLRENNSRYSERIGEWSLRSGAYLAYASSAATYGAGEFRFSDEDALTPGLKPLNPYGQSKLDFDVWVLSRGYERRFTGFRFFNVYGPNEYHKGAMRSLAHKGFEQVRDTGKLKLFKSYRAEYPDGGQKRDFVYVKDVVDAMLWFWKHPDRKGIFNIGAGRAQTWNELAAAIFGALAKPVRIEYVDMPESIKNQYQYFTEADLSKLRAAGCPTRFSDLNEGVGDYIRSHLLQNDPYL
jgi:ADP-L-glycero-D-manno-heptose 6-epimerase